MTNFGQIGCNIDSFYESLCIFCLFFVLPLHRLSHYAYQEDTIEISLALNNGVSDNMSSGPSTILMAQKWPRNGSRNEEEKYIRDVRRGAGLALVK